MSLVEAMKWTFYVAPKGQAFLTGDNPFFFSSLDLNKPNSELSSPISSKVASWLNDVPTGFVKATEEQVIRMNRRCAHCDQRSLFQPSKALDSQSFEKKAPETWIETLRVHDLRKVVRLKSAVR